MSTRPAWFDFPLFLLAVVALSLSCRSLIGVAAAADATSLAEPARVLPAGQLPKDARLQPLKDLDGSFPFHVPESTEAWQQRAESVRRRILVANGLWPMPPRGRVQATIHGRIERPATTTADGRKVPGYAVEKVYFPSHPGFYVTGNLYRPLGHSGRGPAVLTPHGHFNQGRFHDSGAENTKRQIAGLAERFPIGGRHPLQARCVQLARMGCVVFHYDMIGYADSNQLSYQLAHRHAEPRANLDSADAWGLYTAQAEMRLQNVMGLQTYNSLRAFDFVTSLPDVDPKRIAVTGASGGGTQTMILSALEPRVAVSFPAVMVSTAMQGGCTCENACCLRVGTGNVEFAALFAPRPLGLTAADDWTKQLQQKGLPELQKLYQQLGAEPNLRGFAGPEYTQFPHNYNAHSRRAMYGWLNRHLNLGHDEPILEDDYQPLTVKEMTVWNDSHPAPKSGLEFEIDLLGKLSRQSDAQRAAMRQSHPDQWRRETRAALRTILATDWEQVGNVTRENLAKEPAESYILFRDLLSTAQTQLPVIFLHPTAAAWNGQVVVWVSDQGKNDLFMADKESAESASPRGLRPAARHLLGKGFAVAAADLFQQGEFRSDPLEQTRKVANDRDFAGFTFGYNRTLLGHQVHDLLTLLKFVSQDDRQASAIHLLASRGGAAQAVLAKCVADRQITRLAITEGDFRFASVRSWRDPLFLPGALKYGDIPGFLQLCGQQDVLCEETTSLTAAEWLAR